MIGDECRPKYFGSQIISVREGIKKLLTFFWQDSFEAYFEICGSIGYATVSNPQAIDWARVQLNLMQVLVELRSNDIYSTSQLIQIKYRGQTDSLTLQVFSFYSIIPWTTSETRNSDFSSLQDFWEPNGSEFQFAAFANQIDNNIFFRFFDQIVKHEDGQEEKYR